MLFNAGNATLLPLRTPVRRSLLSPLLRRQAQ
jgi:hypothetical protein